MSHNYNYANIATCKGCKRIHKMHGDTDAQIDMPHEIEFVKVSNISPRKNKRISYTSQSYIIEKEYPRSVYSSPKEYSHNYNYGDIGKCKECKRIHDEYGDTDAQIDMPHAFEPMSKKKVTVNKKSKKNPKSKKGGKTKKTMKNKKSMKNKK
jgi:hypothetical protein